MLPELSVDAVHAMLTESSVAAVTCTFVGTVGAVRSGCLGRGAEPAGTAPASTANAMHAPIATRIFMGPLPRARKMSRHTYYGRAPSQGLRRPQPMRASWTISHVAAASATAVGSD